MTQGSLTMERPATPTPDDDAATRRAYADWLRRAMTRTFGPDFKNNQLTAATGGLLKEQTVSRHLNAQVAPTLKFARATIKALDADLAEGLTAAGFGDLVREIADSLAGDDARTRTEDELRRELADLQATVNERISDLQQRLERGRELRRPDRDSGAGQ
jgi:hypothetical protein